jgi:hypothetical protein
VTEAALPPLSEWESFYVIVGSSAAALTGLQFVVIALAADSKPVRDPRTFQAFASPTIVHFCAVLLVAAFLSMPRLTLASVSVFQLVCGLGGLAYMAWVVVQMRRQRSYAPEASDWVWHAIAPAVAYACLAIAGALCGRFPEADLAATAGLTLALLFVGIHNAWDSAVWQTTHRERE